MRYIYKFALLALLIISVSACEDIDKDPFEISVNDGPFGSFVRLDITTAPVLDVTDIANTTFGGTLRAPSNNVASYEMRVRRVSGGAASDFAPLFSTTTFPAEFIANAENLATALGLAVSDLLPGDRFDFEATSIGTDGSVVTFDSFGPNLQGGPGEAQGYRFNTFISCPFVQDEAIGTYTVTVSTFGAYPAGNTFEVIAGDNDNQIIMVNPHGSLLGDPVPIEGAGYEIVVDVTPFGLATVERTIDDVDQYIFDTDPTGNTGFFDTHVEGDGFVFSCAGAIILSLDYDLSGLGGGNFTFGSDRAFSAQKN
ncbi:hypothetical protein [Psychroserpens sp.]